MTFADITNRAITIRQQYSDLEIARTGQEWSRADLMQGFVGDVGDLAKLVMAKEGKRVIQDVDDKLAHELSDCLWSVIVIADKFDIDLEKSFLHTMNELETRIAQEVKNEN